MGRSKHFKVEGLERRVLLSSAIAAFQGGGFYATSGGSHYVAAADLNKDGKLDLVVAEEAGPGELSILIGNGDGSFQPHQTYVVGIHPNCVAVADINGDGNPDLVVAGFQSNNVGILLGNGNGTFRPQFTMATGAGTYPAFVAVADLNGDGKSDIVTANIGSGAVSIFLGNGDGTFRSPRTFPGGSNSVLGDRGHSV